MSTVTTSKKFNLNLSDWVRGLLMAVLVPVIAIISDSIQAGTLTFNWSLILKAALGGGMAYLLKNWLMTPNEITIKNPSNEQVQMVKDGDATAKVVQK